MKIHKLIKQPDVLAWDCHSCISLNVNSNLALLENHLHSGFSFVSINIGMDMNSIEQIVEVISSFRRQIEANPNFIQVQTMDDVFYAKANNKLAISFDLEGGVPLLNNADSINLYHRLGVRQIHLAYNRNNALSGGCYDKDIALTEQGAAMVKAINDAGILMDCSHTGHQSSLDIMEVSDAPVIFSHANVREINSNKRNLTNQQIDACAKQGGVIGVNGVEKFLRPDTPHCQALIEQIDYLVQRVGPNHVGIGLDYVYDKALPELSADVDVNYWWPTEHGYGNGLSDCNYVPASVLFDLVEAMLKLGYDELMCKNILSGNFIRIAQNVWK